MKTNEFINEELIAIINKEAIEHFEDARAKQVIEWVEENLIRDLDDIDDMEETLDLAQSNKDLNALPLTSLLFKFLRQYDNAEITLESYNEISDALERNPENKLLHLFKVIARLEMFEEEETFYSEKHDFLKDLFQKHGYLVRLDDFFDCFFTLIDIFDNQGLSNRPEEFLELVEMAATSFPEKPVLKHYLATAFYYREQYNEALKQFSSLLDTVNSAIDKDTFAEIDFSHLIHPQDILQNMACCYDKLGDDQQALNLLNRVIEDLPVITGPDEDDEEFEDVASYLDSFLLRMRINIRSGKMEAVFCDWSRIKKYFLDISYYEEQYPDVFKVLQDDELQKKFLKDGPLEANSQSSMS